MNSIITCCGKEYRIRRLLGHGKGGYSYLAEADSGQAVVKQIHHEPCDYYEFGNKIEAEKRDYERLRNTGIRIPELIAIDEEAEIIVKEYIAGNTVFDLVRDGGSADPYLDQVRKMAAQASSWNRRQSALFGRSWRHCRLISIRRNGGFCGDSAIWSLPMKLFCVMLFGL